MYQLSQGDSQGCQKKAGDYLEERSVKVYEYAAEVTRVIDGDTVDAEVSLGFHIKFKERFRLYGINAPETRTRNKKEKAAGLRASDFLSKALGMGGIQKSRIMIKTSKDRKGKYGRYLGELILVDNSFLLFEGREIDLKAGTNLNQELVRRRLAKREYYGRKPRKRG